MNDVVVSGVGVVSAAGPTFDSLATALREGRSCASPFATALPLDEVAAVPTPVEALADFVDDRKAWLAMNALEQALVDSGGTGDGIISVFLGTGLSSVTPMELNEDAYPHLTTDGTAFDRDSLCADLRGDGASPWRHDPVRVTSAVAKRVGATGPCGTSFSA